MFVEEFADLLDSEYYVYRVESSLGQYNRPIETEYNEGPYAARLVLLGGSTNEVAPYRTSTANARMYTSADANLKVGDRITINAARYTVELIYKPLNNHSEVELKFEGEV